jgi:hypothetical protein
MPMHDDEQTPPPLPVPPTTPGQLGRRESAWPTAIGVVGIVLGAFGIIGGVWGVVGWAFRGAFMGGMQDSMAGVLDVQNQFMPAMVTTSALLAVAAGLLLVGSIALLRRRPLARPLLTIWAGAKLVLVVAGTSVTASMLIAMFRAMRAASTGSGTPPPNFEVYMAAIAAFFSLVWGLPPPLFILIWFRRTRIRTEIAAWR